MQWENISFQALESRSRIDIVVGISYNDNIGKAIADAINVLQIDDRILKDAAPDSATPASTSASPVGHCKRRLGCTYLGTACDQGTL